MRRLVAVVRCRCPRCLEGAVWRSAFATRETCAVCAFRFEREPGYWTGAMVASYALGVPVLAALFASVLAVTSWDVVPALLVADVLFIGIAPLVWRYSRVVWLHFDWLLDPVRD